MGSRLSAELGFPFAGSSTGCFDSFEFATSCQTYSICLTWPWWLLHIWCILQIPLPCVLLSVWHHNLLQGYGPTYWTVIGNLFLGIATHHATAPMPLPMCGRRPQGQRPIRTCRHVRLGPCSPFSRFSSREDHPVLPSMWVWSLHLTQRILCANQWTSQLGSGKSTIATGISTPLRCERISHVTSGSGHGVRREEPSFVINQQWFFTRITRPWDRLAKISYLVNQLSPSFPLICSTKGRWYWMAIFSTRMVSGTYCPHGRIKTTPTNEMDHTQWGSFAGTLCGINSSMPSTSLITPTFRWRSWPECVQTFSGWDLHSSKLGASIPWLAYTAINGQSGGWLRANVQPNVATRLLFYVYMLLVIFPWQWCPLHVMVLLGCHSWNLMTILWMCFSTPKDGYLIFYSSAWVHLRHSWRCKIFQWRSLQSLWSFTRCTLTDDSITTRLWCWIHLRTLHKLVAPLVQLPFKADATDYFFICGHSALCIFIFIHHTLRLLLVSH